MTPEERGIEVDRSIHKIYNQDKALLELEGMAEDHFGRHLDNIFERFDVWWTTTICPYSDDPAVIYEGICYYGRMWSCQEAYVALPLTGGICGSALLHEFAHCLTMHLTGSGWADADHKGEIWAIVAEAHSRACNRESATGTIEQWNAASRQHLLDCQIEVAP